MELFLESFWPMFRAGLTVSVPLMLVSFALGLVLAFIIALMRMSKLPPLKGIAWFIVWVIPWHTSAGTDLRNILWTAVYRHRFSSLFLPLSLPWSSAKVLTTLR